jgi:hypothetical protein
MEMNRDRLIQKLIEAGINKYIIHRDIENDGIHVCFDDLDTCNRRKIEVLVKECGDLTDKGVWFRVACPHDPNADNEAYDNHDFRN